MKKHKFILFTTLFFILLLSGCSENKNENENENENKKKAIEENTTDQIKQEIPEPYTKAITAINNKNFTLANTYLDLVIKDFPDSEYILPSQILKGSMQISQYLVASDLLDIFTSSAEPDSPLFDDEDRETLQSHLNTLQDIFDKFSEEQKTTFNYIAQTFDVKKDYSDYFKDIEGFLGDSEYPDTLSFFEEVGYPVPTNSEVREFTDTLYDLYVCTVINKIINDGEKLNAEQLNYNYLFFFSNVGMTLKETNPEVANTLLNFILDITSDDPYNEYRISIEEIMEKSTNTVSKNENSGSKQDNTQSKTTEDSKYDPFEWGTGIKEEFENEMIQNEYVDSKDNLFYKNGYIGEDNQGYYEAFTIDDNGEERYIVVVNVKTGWYHG
ncbi:hypothetical protein ACQKNC_11400 [Lysinibacillus sp. NPDC094177]|uniref:hypothetical protein n=1 Tax=Lysinibacillus sp. NPDC094177 TaxID=3390580 RepID=UPI003CFDB953